DSIKVGGWSGAHQLRDRRWRGPLMQLSHGLRELRHRGPPFGRGQHWPLVDQRLSLDAAGKHVGDGKAVDKGAAVTDDSRTGDATGGVPEHRRHAGEQDEATAPTGPQHPRTQPAIIDQPGVVGAAVDQLRTASQVDPGSRTDLPQPFLWAWWGGPVLTPTHPR